MILYRAAWVVPITTPPIQDGWVVVDRQRIVAVGRTRTAQAATPTVDLGAVALLPGLVNAHTHLELSWMRGRIGPRDGFPGWIREVVRLNRTPDSADPMILREAVAAIDEAERFGTALVGDIGNTLISFGALAAGRVAAMLFNELIGFNADEPEAVVRRARGRLDGLPPHDTLRTSIAAHAPYSVAPRLFRAIRDDLDSHPFARTSVHLGESREEVEFLETGTGPWRDLLDDLGAWNPQWTTPRCPPVSYLDRLGFIDDRVLVVHGVHLTPPELQQLSGRGATLVTCPRGNIRTGAGTPPIEAFYRSGARVAIGTDSLASVDDLNLFAEVAALRALAPAVPAGRLLYSATRAGAEALGFAGEFGAIEPGLRARLIAVDVPPDEADVEEYLVRGIDADRIRWIE